MTKWARNSRKYVLVVIAGILLVSIVCMLVVGWLLLPTVAGVGLRYEVSKDVSEQILVWLGARAVDQYLQATRYDGAKWADHLMELSQEAEINTATRHILLDSLASPDAKDTWGRSLLHYTAVGDLPRLTMDLLDKGANVSAADKDGYTPLCLARSVKMAELLIARGADINARDGPGEGTKLHAAASQGNIEMLRFLLSIGADPNLENKGRNAVTPLWDAMCLDQKEAARILLENGADPNAADETGWSLLHFAVRQNWPDMVDLLLTKGADPLIKAGGETPLELAVETARDHRIVRILVTSCKGKGYAGGRKVPGWFRDNPKFLNNLAWVLATSDGKTEEDAKVALEMAARANEVTGGSDPVTLEVLAATYGANGDYKEASEVQEKVVRMNPNDVEARNRLMVYKHKAGL